MALLTTKNLTLSFGSHPLLNGVEMQIDPGERVCLVGRNGEGKSTLMRVIAGEIEADQGEIIFQKGLRIGRLSQEVPTNLTGSAYDVVASGLDRLFDLLSRYHAASHRLQTDHSDAAMAELEEAQHDLETANGWLAHQRVEAVLSRLSLPADQPFNELSGGLKRRVLLARALAGEPDLLLLDEPTNHLDITAITWLEEFLLGFPGALLFVTHDRALLKKLATRIVELDRGTIASWPGDYPTYLRRREEVLAAEAAQNNRFDKKLAQEEVWIRQGIKARRTRNEGRVQALEAMRKERAARRGQTGKVRLQLQEVEASGKLVVSAKQVSFGFGDTPIIANLTATIMRGDHVGIIGPNGVGKSTLLKLLLGQLEPQHGVIKFGTKIETCYFDQNREQLDPDKSVADNVADGHDTVLINGQPRHIIGYLQDFLFAPARSRSPVSVLSGGEKNRLLLAKLFTHPFNVLVMDEPTNDLDVETLELLEELLLDYKGTLLLVSHDRTFLNNVVSSSLVFEGDGRVVEYAGGYDDWLAQRPEAETRQATGRQDRTEQKERAKKEKAAKLSYKEERELESLPQRIESMETEQRELYDRVADPAFYQQDPSGPAKANERLAALDSELAAAYSRWEELEAIREAGSAP